MPDFAWGLQMMVVGMGVVFGLLAVLMGVLIVIGRLDARGGTAPLPEAPAPEATPPTPAPDTAPAVRIIADGLDENQVAAIVVAVITHAEVRRRSAAPEARAYAPGSQLFASRWVAIGRGNQQAPYKAR
jgi:sodium pump decarboxylase gamma subunit